jgi:hypothetical protein
MAQDKITAAPPGSIITSFLTVIMIFAIAAQVSAGRRAVFRFRLNEAAPLPGPSPIW